MAWITRLLGFATSPLALIVAGLAVLGGTALYVHHLGYAEASAHYIALGDAEAARQADANEKAQATLQSQVADLQQDNDQLNRQLVENQKDADNDPMANACTLSLDGVLRHNKLLPSPKAR